MSRILQADVILKLTEEQATVLNAALRAAGDGFGFRDPWLKNFALELVKQIGEQCAEQGVRL